MAEGKKPLEVTDAEMGGISDGTLMDRIASEAIAREDLKNVVPIRQQHGGNPNIERPVEIGIPVECNLPTGIAAPEPGTGLAGIDDLEAFFNMRDWLQKACEAAGARKTGGGIGCGQADIDIELEGHHYAVSIRPIRTG